MDITDKKILEILSKNACATATEIGEAVGLSIPAVNKRIAKLQSGGYIKRFTLLTDGVKMGKPIVAFILVVLRYSDGTEAFLQYINKDPDVLECYAVTGDYDYIVKICAPSVSALERKLLDLKKQKGVVKSHTMLSLEEHKLSPTILPDTDSDEV